MEQQNIQNSNLPQVVNNQGSNKGEDFLIKNNKGFVIAASVTMILTGLIFVYYAITSIGYTFDVIVNSWYYSGSVIIQYVIAFISYIATIVGLIGGAVILLSNKGTNLIKVFIFIIAGSYVLSAITNLLSHINYGYGFSTLLPVFINLILAALWIIISLPLVKKDININFIIPLVITGVIMIIHIIIGAINYYYFLSYLNILLESAALALCGLAVRHLNTPYVKGDNTMSNTQQNNYNQIPQNPVPVQNNYNQIEPEGFIKIWVLVVLSIVTFGIYTLIWVYKTVGLLNNKLPQSQQYGQAAQLLLCMFVPFYAIYWVYKTCKRIEEYSYRLNSGNSDLSLIGLLLTIFGFAIVAYALMQDQINKNIMIEVNGGARPQQTAQQAYVQPQQQAAPQNTNFVPQQVEPVPQPVHQAAPAPQAAAPAEKQKIKVTKEQYESLLRIKELLDMDIISKEEFIQKKNEILNM